MQTYLPLTVWQYSAAALAGTEIASGTAKAAAAASEVKTFIEVVDCGVTPVHIHYDSYVSRGRHPYEGFF